ncbi:hypothetical protein, partial [Rhodopseudomonas faecalis]|uniref:hypothetical protein n=1 Tax=Rhodopseudomonas faecalis TaxID=99655 RepID=UPI001AEC74FF
QLQTSPGPRRQNPQGLRHQQNHSINELVNSHNCERSEAIQPRYQAAGRLRYCAPYNGDPINAA